MSIVSTRSVGSCSEGKVSGDVDPVGAGDDVAESEVWGTFGVAVKCIDIIASVSGFWPSRIRDVVIGTAGL